MTTRLHQLEQENSALREFVEKCRDAIAELNDSRSMTLLSGYMKAQCIFCDAIRGAYVAIQDLPAGEGAGTEPHCDHVREQPDLDMNSICQEYDLYDE